MQYSEEFIRLVEDAKFNYIGHGNPNAKILIISKESSIDRSKPAGNEQYRREIFENCKQWDVNINNRDTISYDTLIDSCDYPHIGYNPLYPYKGQKSIIRCLAGNKDGMPVYRGEGGTSRTWVAYQNLCDNILGKQNLCDDKIIDFHRFMFTTDFSAESAPMSNQTNAELTLKSIVERKEMFKYKFFQSFPIIIVSAGHYPKRYGIDMEELFSVKWIGKIEICNKGKFYNVHYSIDRRKLLIHTVHLSFYSNDLICRISQIVRDFIRNDLKEDVGKFLS